MPDLKLCRHEVVSDDYQDFILTYYGRKDLLDNSDIGCYQLVNEEYAVVHTREERDRQTASKYEYTQVPKAYGLMAQNNLEEIGVSRLRRLNGFEYYGQGVLLGFVDTGIDYAHPAFLRADGTSRVLSIWDQNDQTGEPPEGFLYGTQFSEEAINAGLAPKDENGHGTALAGIAGGRQNTAEQFYGVASQAEIVMVKLKPIKPYLRSYYLLPEEAFAYSETDIMLGIRYLTEYAGKRKRPLVLCLGLGSASGNHTGGLPLSGYLNRVANALNVCLVLAAGNEGNARHHHYGTVHREQKEVELKVGKEKKGFTMELWSSSIARLRLGLISPSGEKAELPNLLRYEQSYRFLFDRTTVWIYSERQERRSNETVVFFRFEHPSEGSWKITVSGYDALSEGYHLWLPITGFVGEETYFPEADPYVTICEPANAPMPIAVTGIRTQNGGLYTESGRGYSADGQIRPTLAAPAANIRVPFAGGGYTLYSGTSLAAAYTAGCAAVFFEAAQSASEDYLPFDTVLLRNLFANGAKRTESAVYPNRELGYGVLDLYGTLQRFQN